MSKLEIADTHPAEPFTPLLEREEHAEFLSSASKLLMRTSRLVASDLDVDTTLASIACLILPHPDVWSVLEVAEGIGTRPIGATSQHQRPPAGSILTVALRAGDETLGSLTFSAPLGGHVFDERDRQLAKDVAAGASLAIVASRHAATRAQSPEVARRFVADRLDFISALSHGLRTPLHAIHGYAQLLDVEVRGAPLSLEDISVRTAVRLTNTIIMSAATKNGVFYDPESDAIDDGLTVRAEPRRLREILLQLMLNAVKFSKPPAALGVHAVDVGKQIWIRISDTGIGITQEHLDSIFRPFGHTGAPYHETSNGVGLGLAITQRLARAMDGELSVVSAVGRGSTFTLALPRGRLQ
jgi:signal transduction histidine kinase